MPVKAAAGGDHTQGGHLRLLIRAQLAARVQADHRCALGRRERHQSTIGKLAQCQLTSRTHCHHSLARKRREWHQSGPVACDSIAQPQLATRIRAACKEASLHVHKGRMRRACGRTCNRDAAEGGEGHRTRLVAVETRAQPAAAAGTKGERDALVVDEDRVLMASGDCVHLMREVIRGPQRQSEVIDEDTRGQRPLRARVRRAPARQYS